MDANLTSYCRTESFWHVDVNWHLYADFRPTHTYSPPPFARYVWLHARQDGLDTEVNLKATEQLRKGRESEAMESAMAKPSPVLRSSRGCGSISHVEIEFSVQCNSEEMVAGSSSHWLCTPTCCWPWGKHRGEPPSKCTDWRGEWPSCFWRV